ncbi:MAG: polyprenyl synthetase family protein [Paludibacteraceae bacterium]|nr:polyprenyl synthetase family protein [Paludibacteraceae bacterium]
MEENVIEKLQQRFERALKSCSFSGEPQGLYDPIGYVLSIGGKRVRPTLCLLACRLYGGDESIAMKAAMGLEVFHNFTLLHDDIMDRADTRRGQATVHVKWNDNVAILSGDAMLIKAYQLMSGVPEASQARVNEIFSQTALEVCEGQQYDMDFEHSDQVSLDDYLRMIRLKTAVLLAASLQIGALLGGADKFNQEKLYEFGIQMGLAFQLRDDLLDAFGDPKLFGKKIGGDIRCGKRTYLRLVAEQAADAQTKAALQQLFALPASQDGPKVEQVLAIYKALGVKEATEAAIEKCFAKSMVLVDSLDLQDEQKEVLTRIAHDLTGRER